MSGSDLFVANSLSGTIRRVHHRRLAVVNASLVTGLSSPKSIVVSGGDLFVVNSSSGTIGEYTTAGAVVNASLVTGLSFPAGLVAGCSRTVDLANLAPACGRPLLARAILKGRRKVGP